MTTVRKQFATALLVASGICALAPAHAEDSADEDTISVVEENATPEGVVNTIRLPPPPPAAAAEPGAAAQGAAGSAREQGRAVGKQLSKEVRKNNPSEQVRDKVVRDQKGSDKKPKKDKMNK
jgi:hypothetical protein